MLVITGVAGFIGNALALKLLRAGETVIGLDNLNSYYDPSLKKARLARLSGFEAFKFIQVDIADKAAFTEALRGVEARACVHLAAQAGVRYSIENPEAYVRSNLLGHTHVLEWARHQKLENLVYASSSSVYGDGVSGPCSETDPTDKPVSFYGATKKSNEVLSYSYARLYGLSITGLRFFTVYGPWGRPDMAYWLFADAIRKGRSIDIFNQGKMQRDFTYIDDIVSGIMAAIDRPVSEMGLDVPHRIYNLGNDNPENLMDFVTSLESHLGEEAIKAYKSMQLGDVKSTWANIDRARSELGYDPHVSLTDGLKAFVNWFDSCKDL